MRVLILMLSVAGAIAVTSVLGQEQGTEKPVKLQELPPAVQEEQQTTLSEIPEAARTAIQKAATGGKLSLVERVIEGASTFYEGHIMKGGKEIEIKVDANGKPVE